MNELRKNTEIKETKVTQMQPQPDYYVENGLLVFTASYHLKRGHCCGNGCRHCPYRGKNKK